MAGAARDERDDTQQQAHQDNLVDTFEVGSGGRPFFRVDVVVKLPPRDEKQPDKQRDHHPDQQIVAGDAVRSAIQIALAVPRAHC